MPVMESLCFEEVIFIGYGLYGLIHAYKAILMLFNPAGSGNLNIYPDSDPKFKKLILVHNCQ
jgi:hypothetical protein